MKRTHFALLAVASLCLALSAGCTKKKKDDQPPPRSNQGMGMTIQHGAFTPVPPAPNARGGMNRGRNPRGRKPNVRKPAGPEYAGAHILISYKGAKRAKPAITRTKEEAKKLATELTAKAKKTPDKFADLAKANSNGPSAPKGGSLGTWRKGRMVPAFDAAIEKIKIGEVVGPVETPFGFHVIKRLALPPSFAGRHILIAYKGARRAKPTITRTKEEALKHATDLAKKAAANAKGFADLAKANSDGPSGPRGGSLGVWKKGRMVPAFQDAIDKLKIGGVTAKPVETPFGYHVIIREDPAKMKR